MGIARLRDVPEPTIEHEDDPIVRITVTTICGGDLHLLDGSIPTEPGFVVGHEYVGVVEAVGSAVTRHQPGTRVAGAAIPYCGRCRNCRHDHSQRCLRGGILGAGEPWGGLAGVHTELARIPFADTSLEPIPDSVSDEMALFVGDSLSTGYFGVRSGRGPRRRRRRPARGTRTRRRAWTSSSRCSKSAAWIRRR